VALGVTTLVLVTLALIAVPTLYGHFPELFGHFRFYRTCKALNRGMSVADARAKMGAFLEVGRSYHAKSPIEGAFFEAAVLGMRESPRERTTRLLFIPNAKEGADWCIVYADPTGTKVERVEISPD